MDPQKQIEQLVDMAEKTTDTVERQELNSDANEIHERATGGHPMKFDAQGHIDRNDQEAKKCPFMKSH
ncbi:unnamed protein product [Cunninghamella blakesleeana]